MSTPLERLIAKTRFFGEMNPRLAALERLQRIAESQLEFARANEITRVRAEHISLGDQVIPEDRAFDLNELEQQVTHLLPKLTRGGLLLTVWSVFERSVKDIVLRATRHVGKPQPKFRGEFIPSVEESVMSAVGITAFPDLGIREELKFLAGIRNTLIHHDGRLDEAPDAIKSLSVESLSARGIQLERDYTFTYLVPTEVFLKNAVILVFRQAHGLADRVFDSLFPVAARDA